ncbi:MAG: hypothetical protein ACI9OJ_003990 [Myxococcota bacterium]|jgi:hypothetical protein
MHVSINPTELLVPVRWVAAVLLAALLAGGCSNPTSGPEGTAVIWLEAQAARDVDTLYGLLDGPDRARFETLHKTLVASAALIEKAIPSAESAAAHAAIGTDVLSQGTDPQDGPADPKALFAQLLGQSGEAVKLSTTERWGIRPRTTAARDGATLVTTWGGDSVLVVEIGDAFTVRLDPDDSARLDALLATAGSNHARLSQLQQTRQRQRFGASR